jgi:hypothetical protein
MKRKEEAMKKYIMYKPSSTTYDYIWGAFFSSCSGNGTKDHST